MGLLKAVARYVLRHELRQADVELARAAMRQDEWRQHALGLEVFCADQIGPLWRVAYAAHFAQRVERAIEGPE